jgi:hypothetical protein
VALAALAAPGGVGGGSGGSSSSRRWLWQLQQLQVAAVVSPAAPGGSGKSDSLEETGSNICCLPAFFGQISGRWAQDAVGPRIDSSPSSLFFCFIIAGRGSWA